MNSSASDSLILIEGQDGTDKLVANVPVNVKKERTNTAHRPLPLSPTANG